MQTLCQLHAVHAGYGIQDMITISLMGNSPILQIGKLELRESRTYINLISSFELHPELTMTSRNPFYLQM